jgi:deoxyadenosine/deoxycytidine kinase
MSQLIKPPDLLIYLKASIPTLVEHIQDRGREYEGNISLDYLKKLNKRYDAWIESYDSGNLLIINVDELDFMRNDADFGEVLERVNAHIHGLF